MTLKICKKLDLLRGLKQFNILYDLLISIFRERPKSLLGVKGFDPEENLNAPPSFQGTGTVELGKHI